jgi:adenosylcobinamide hydrolase
MGTIEGVDVSVGPEAVVIRAERPLRVLSSAVAFGGLGHARAIVNLHVGRDCPWEDADTRLAPFVTRCRLPWPWVGLLTAASTERARIAIESAGGVQAVVVATVGLGNPVAAGRSEAARAEPGTINTIVLVDAAVEPAALVNLAVTVTEAKTLVLLEAGVRAADGGPATGTSTDAVVVAATGRGASVRFGGPVSDMGWLVARAARRAFAEGVHDWLEHEP